MVTDARSNTKTWINLWWTDSNVTEDDGSTEASTAIMYAYPPYALTREFKDKMVDGLILIGEPNSTPQRSGDQIIRRYEEHVPIILATVDKTGITGTKLRWKMEAELRRIAETKPTGSQHNLERRSDRTERVGSTTIYLVEYVLNFMRGTT